MAWTGLVAFVVALVVACGGPSAADPDAGSRGDAGSDSGSAGSARLYPLALGEHWTFSVTAVGAGSVCAAGTHEQRVVSADPIGTHPAFQVTEFCSGITQTSNYAAGPDDEVDFYYQGNWLVLVDPMLTEGHSWPYFNSRYHWHREATVTVPAGSYDDCWTAVQEVSYTAYLTYCRGVGLVRSYSSDLAGNGWDARLASVAIP